VTNTKELKLMAIIFGSLLVAGLAFSYLIRGTEGIAIFLVLAIGSARINEKPGRCRAGSVSGRCTLDVDCLANAEPTSPRAGPSERYITRSDRANAVRTDAVQKRPKRRSFDAMRTG
jgi:hypothetical protein